VPGGAHKHLHPMGLVVHMLCRGRHVADAVTPPDVARDLLEIPHHVTAVFREIGDAARQRWRERSAATFVETYRETIKGQSLWPDDAAAADRLLDFFLVEKAYYEIEYELSHRPDWLRVPLAGILRILSAQETAA